jgi:thioredoxin reductase
MTEEPAPFDVAIVGGGPAGQAAALVLCGVGAHVAVIDEQQRPGGQILRQPPREFTARRWLPGASHRDLKAQLRAFEALEGANWLGGRSAIGLSADEIGFRLWLSTPHGTEELRARRVLIAAGCYELPLCVPGWTLPGVMGAGGLQALVKAQGVVPGDRLVLTGTHPLMLIVAEQILEAGGTVAEVAFEQPFSRIARIMAAGSTTALRNSGPLGDAAKAWWKLRRSGVPIRFGRRLTAIGGRQAVEHAIFEKGAGTEYRVACDGIGLCFGFLPQSDLPRLAGLEMRWTEPGGWAAVHDGWMRSSIAGIFVAGETTGVAGAAAASAEGRIAGTGLAFDLGILSRGEAELIRRAATRELAHANRFAALLARVSDPTDAMARLRPADAIVCRCEDVTLGEIESALAVFCNASAVKLATRCGMGLCQGRGCEPMLMRLAAARWDVPPAELRGFTARFPARPTRIGDLAG